jgi:hypothetical protein
MDALLRAAREALLSGRTPLLVPAVDALLVLAHATEGEDSLPLSAAREPCAEVYALALRRRPTAGVELARALAGVDPTGTATLAALERRDTPLDPRAFAVLACALAGGPRREEFVARERALLSDAAAPWKARLLAIRAMRLLDERAALPELRALLAAEDRRLASIDALEGR